MNNYWKKDKFVTSELENYLSAMKDQELPTKYLKNKRARDTGKTPDRNNKCRLCTTNVENISHIIAGCSHMSARYYLLLLRHDEVAKTLLNSHLKRFYPSENITLSSEPEYIYKEDSCEYWCNVSVKKAKKVPHNKLDLMIWHQEVKICSMIEFTCLLDISINRKVNQKLGNYGPLVRNLQIMHPEYKFQVAPIVIGAMRYVPICSINYLKMIGFNENESKVLISKLEIKPISGTVNICKTFLNFTDPFHDSNFTSFLHEATIQIYKCYKTSTVDPLSL